MDESNRESVICKCGHSFYSGLVECPMCKIDKVETEEMVEYIAQNIFKIGSHPAPREYGEIQEVKDARPKGVGFESSLQELDGTNICIWYKRSSVYWNPCSDPFIITAQVKD